MFRRKDPLTIPNPWPRMLLTGLALAAVGGAAMLALRRTQLETRPFAVAEVEGAESTAKCKDLGAPDELVIVGRGTLRQSGAADAVATTGGLDARAERELERVARRGAAVELAERIESLAHDVHRWGSDVADRSADEWRAIAARVLESAPRSASHRVDPQDARRLLGDVTYRIDIDALERYVRSSRHGSFTLNPIAGAALTAVTIFVAYLILRGVTRCCARRAR
ncbi:MAG: hypothetical protein CHACPFDD_03284 [Phycisphaerae bacterium]|nr:hypothetical protein [Phycisphaerae bacterium]